MTKEKEQDAFCPAIFNFFPRIGRDSTKLQNGTPGLNQTQYPIILILQIAFFSNLRHFMLLILNVLDAIVKSLQ